MPLRRIAHAVSAILIALTALVGSSAIANADPEDATPPIIDDLLILTQPPAQDPRALHQSHPEAPWKAKAGSDGLSESQCEMPEDGLLGFTIGVQRVDHAPVRGTKTKWAGTAPRPAEVAPPRRPHRIPGESHGRRSCPRFGPAPAPPTAPVRLGTKRRDRSGHISNRPGPSPRLAPNRQAPDRYRRTPSLPSRRLVVSAVTPHPPGSRLLAGSRRFTHGGTSFAQIH